MTTEQAHSQHVLVCSTTPPSPALRDAAATLGLELQHTTDPDTAANALITQQPGIAWIGITGPAERSLELLSWSRTHTPWVACIAETADLDVTLQGACLRAGAIAALATQGSPPRLHQRWLQHAATLSNARRRGAEPTALERLWGHTPCMQALKQRLPRLAPHPSPILIQGETGTGKEVLAQLLHALSGRRGPFVAINCGTLTPDLAAATLFGSKKGAFTGATQDRAGVFQEARGGTLLLDEIGDLSPELQVMLLRVLQEGTVRPLGGRPQEVDVRVLAATHRDLHALADRGGFRSDLLFRLEVLSLQSPPLRERTADIPSLVMRSLDALNARLPEPIREVEPEAMERLCAQRWPGNVRQLLHTLERAAIEVDEGILATSHLGLAPGPSLPTPTPPPAPDAALLELPWREARVAQELRFARWYVDHHLARSRGQIKAAAEHACMERSNFSRLMRRIRESQHGGT